jgi:hypothetical protein
MDSSNPAIDWANSSALGAYRINVDLSDNWTIYYDSDDDGSNYSNRMRIASDGKVMINTTTASGQLRVESGNTSRTAIFVNMPSSSSVAAQTWQYNGTNAADVTVTSSTREISMDSWDNGTGTGCVFSAGRNNSTTPAPGSFFCVNKDNYGAWLYLADGASRLWRTYSAAPTDSNDTSGTVVGDQTSNIAYKNIIGEPIAPTESLDHMREAVSTIRRFEYKASYSGEFEGIIIHNGNGIQRYGKDPDPEHDGGKALDEVTAIGDLMKVCVWQADRIEALEQRVAELEGA